MTDFLHQRRVGIYRCAHPCGYHRPEIEAAVESVLSLAGLEPSERESRRGPLASLIFPGETVLLKPNMVHPGHGSTDDWESVMTHGEIVRAVALLAAEALAGSGRLLIGDGASPEADFGAAAESMGLQSLKEEILRESGIFAEILDLREQVKVNGGELGSGAVPTGDPEDYCQFDLGERSEFGDGGRPDGFVSSAGDRVKPRWAHSDGRHVYRVARTVLGADVLINLPKMKTHHKTGVSLSLKNLVGIHGDRDYLPHRCENEQESGGGGARATPSRLLARRQASAWLHHLTRRRRLADSWMCFLRVPGEWALGPAEEVWRPGDWHGNDVAWRMVLDVNKLAYYGRKDGTIGCVPNKRLLNVVDGVVAGEGDGPLKPDAKRVGLLVAGMNPVAVDAVGCIVMGFDPSLIKMVSEAWTLTHLPLAAFGPPDVECRSNLMPWNGGLEALMQAQQCGFAPSPGWKGHVELK